MPIVLRSVKGSALSHAELDGNFSELVSVDAGKAAASHTHTASDVTDFSEAVDDRVATLLVAGANVALTYNDATGQLTISATGGGGGGVADDPVTLTGNTTLTWPDAQGKYYSVNSASAVALTLPSGVGTNAVKIVGVNVGAGALSFVAGGGESILAHAILPSTVDQYSPFELRRFGSSWVRVA